MLVSNVAFGEEWACNYANIRGSIGLRCTNGERVVGIPTFGDHRDNPDQEAAWERVNMLVQIAVCSPTQIECVVTIRDNEIAGNVYVGR